MPVYRSRTVVELARHVRAFLNLDVGLVRGDVPDLWRDHNRLGHLHQELERTRKRLADKDRQLQRALERPKRKGPPAPASRPGQKAGASTRNRVRPEKQAEQAIMGDPRDHFIGRVAKGRSFADVGGLHGTTSEKVSVAHSYGATALAMIDAAPEGDELWQAFSERMRYFGVSEYNAISDSILDLAESPDPPGYDVVHCAGVLHHVPDPVRFLSALRKITREYLVLGSVVTATRINANGETLELPSAASLFIPALKERERAILEDYWRSSGSSDALGLRRKQKPQDMEDFAPWWWLPTVDSMRAMCESAGFDREEGAHYGGDNAYVMLLSRRPQDEVNTA